MHSFSLPESVQLICVSKFHPASAILSVYGEGERHFGESRAQELADKAAQLPADICWHFIGHLQTNKVRQVVRVAYCIQSVDSLRLLQLIDREAERLGKTQRVLLEVHVAWEETKSGFSPDELRALVRSDALRSLQHVQVDGLMGMATQTDDEAEIRRCFALLQTLSREAQEDCPAVGSELSMGMSDDYLLALEYGATMVRIGSAIFGSRSRTNQALPAAVFFDMDGVLFDSMPHHAQAWDEVMTRHGLHFPPEETYRNEGRTGQSVIREAMLRYRHREPEEAEWQAIYAEKTARFHELGATTAIPGVADVLHYLHSRWVSLWIVTGSGQQSLFSQLDSFFPGIFAPERMITAFDVTHGKPDPEPYRKAQERSGFPPERCVVVENAPLGVRAAVGAGIRTLAVNTGPLPDSDLLSEGAYAVFPDMPHLKAYFTDGELTAN